MNRVALLSLHTCPYEQLGMFDAGGMNVAIKNLARELGSLGWLVDIYTQSHKQRHVIQVPTSGNIRLFHIPLSSEKILRKKEIIKYINEFIDKAVKANNSWERYKVIHAQYYLSGLAALKIRSVYKSIPVIQTFHTLAKLKEIHGGEIDQKRFDTEYSIIQNSDAIIVFTELERTDLLKHYNAKDKKIFVIPPGVNTKIFKPRDQKEARNILDLDTDCPIILFVGRIDPIKGISTLIKAVGILSRKHKVFKEKFQVLLVGGDIGKKEFWGNPEVRRIQQIIEKQNLSCCIKFIGATPQKKLPHYYAASDVVVLPSLYESFGLVILEAMAMGSAVIASCVGGLRFMVEDGKTGLLFESQNADQLAEKIWYLLEHKDLIKTIGKKASVFAQQFSWSDHAKLVSLVYSRMALSSV